MSDYYARAPITEAVIELRFAEEISKDLIQKVQARLNNDYVITEPWAVRNVQIDIMSVSASLVGTSEGFKLADLDRVEVCIVNSHTFVVSRLAPYTHWEELFERAKRDWANWKRVVGYTRIARVGVRYINRIDIPFAPGEPIELSEYLKCYPTVPGISGFPPIANYAMQLNMPSGADGLNLIINSSTLISPVPNHTSIALDIDLSRENDVPQNDDDLWDFISRIRDHKNTVFEACIGERSRALFA